MDNNIDQQPLIPKGAIIGLIVAIVVGVFLYMNQTAALNAGQNTKDKPAVSEADVQSNMIGSDAPAGVAGAQAEDKPQNTDPLLQGVVNPSTEGINFGKPAATPVPKQQVQQQTQQAPKQPLSSNEGVKQLKQLQTKKVDIVTYSAYEIEGPSGSFVVKSKVGDQESHENVISRAPSWTKMNEVFDFVEGKIYVVNGYKDIVEIYTTTNAGFEYKDAIKLPSREDIGIAFGITCANNPECIVRTSKASGSECSVKVNIKSKKSYEPDCD